MAGLVAYLAFGVLTMVIAASVADERQRRDLPWWVWALWIPTWPMWMVYGYTRAFADGFKRGYRRGMGAAMSREDRETRWLRRRVERPTVVYLWGEEKVVTPRLVREVFGDGRTLLALSPIMYRPNYFVVRIDSSWSLSNWDKENPMTPGEWLDDVYDAIEDEFPEWPWAEDYGLSWSEDDSERSSRTNFNDGSEWGELEWPRRGLLAFLTNGNVRCWTMIHRRDA